MKRDGGALSNRRVAPGFSLGLDHLRVTYMHNGRAERPTVVAGKVIPQLFA